MKSPVSIAIRVIDVRNPPPRKGDSTRGRRIRHLDTATIHTETLNGEKIPLNITIVPEIAVPIKTHRSKTENLKYLSDLKLAHPAISEEGFHI